MRISVRTVTSPAHAAIRGRARVAVVTNIIEGWNDHTFTIFTQLDVVAGETESLLAQCGERLLAFPAIDEGLSNHMERLRTPPLLHLQLQLSTASPCATLSFMICVNGLRNKSSSFF